MINQRTLMFIKNILLVNSIFNQMLRVWYNDEDPDDDCGYDEYDVDDHHLLQGMVTSRFLTSLSTLVRLSLVSAIVNSVKTQGAPDSETWG